MNLPEKIANERELDDVLSIPMPGVTELMGRLDGDIMILGIAGKMGVSLGRQAVNAIRAAGVEKSVYGVARFSDAEQFGKLAEYGIKAIKCDLSDPDEVAKLPRVKNIIFMAGRKFGTGGGGEALTWKMNVIVPAIVGRHFAGSRMVAFSTGCIYPLIPADGVNCTEAVTPEPVGEYAQSCLGRERVFESCLGDFGGKLLLYRLNYAIDLRYGVLHDVASKVWNNEPIQLGVNRFNIIWQGDANAYALRALELADNPAVPLNVTGQETLDIRDIALEFGRAFGREVKFEGEPGTCYLSDASRCFELLGRPNVSLEWMVKQQAEWFLSGGRSLGKPTHFEVNNGKF